MPTWINNKINDLWLNSVDVTTSSPIHNCENCSKVDPEEAKKDANESYLEGFAAGVILNLTAEKASKTIERVIFNDPATIVFWADGEKTVVKANNEPYDKEKGLAMAIIKKIYGNKGNYNNIFKKYIKD